MWALEGEYMETCNCAFLCPCITSNLVDTPTEGDCKAAVAMHITKGEKDGVKLDGLSLVVMILSPGPMAEGNMTVGLIVDETADEAQTEAIAAIASGAVGGPMAALAPLVGTMAGVEKRPITFERDGLKVSVTAGDLLDQAIEALPSAADPAEPIALENTAHPVNQRLALAKATKSVMHVFGIDWEDMTGQRNGHMAPFSWQG